MSMRCLTVIIEQSLGRCSVLADTATVTGRGTLDVDASATNGDFRWPPAGTSRGHQRGPQLATSGDFLMATDNWRLHRPWTDPRASAAELPPHRSRRRF